MTARQLDWTNLYPLSIGNPRDTGRFACYEIQNFWVGFYVPVLSNLSLNSAFVTDVKRISKQTKMCQIVDYLLLLWCVKDYSVGVVCSNSIWFLFDWIVKFTIFRHAQLSWFFLLYTYKLIHPILGKMIRTNWPGEPGGDGS